MVKIKPVLSKAKQSAQEKMMSQYEVYKSLYRSIERLAKKTTIQAKVAI